MRRYRRDDRKSLVTSAGTVEYRDVGSGPPVVFVHGALLNGALWNDVAFYLPTNLRLILPDLPLGGHRVPAAANADPTPPALARLLHQLFDALDLRDIILVASDSGEAICRHAIAAAAPTRPIRGLLLTNCDAFDEHPPGRIANADALDEAALDSLASKLSTCEGRGLFFQRLMWAALPDEQGVDLLGGFMADAAIRGDALRALSRGPVAVAGTSVRFDGHVTIIWGLDDSALPIAIGERLAATFPRAELWRVRQTGLLVPLDQPELMAEAVIDMVERSLQAGSMS